MSIHRPITVADFLKLCSAGERLAIRIIDDDIDVHIPATYITDDLTESQREIDRVLSYYGNTPVWGIHIEQAETKKSICDMPKNGCIITFAIVANCYSSDIIEGYKLEQSDLRQKRKRNRQRR